MSNRHALDCLRTLIEVQVKRIGGINGAWVRAVQALIQAIDEEVHDDDREMVIRTMARALGPCLVRFNHLDVSVADALVEMGETGGTLTVDGDPIPIMRIDCGLHVGRLNVLIHAAVHRPSVSAALGAARRSDEEAVASALFPGSS